MTRPHPLGGRRVVLVVGTYPVVSETFIERVFHGLVDTGVDVHLVAWDGEVDGAGIENGRVHLVRHVGSRRRTLGSLLALGRGALRRPATTARFVRAHLRRARPQRFRHLVHGLAVLGLDPDVVHFQFGWHAHDLSALGEALDARFVVSFRGADICHVGLDDPDYYTRVWPLVDAVHCRSRDLWHRALERGCPSTLPCVVVPPGVDADRFVPGDRGDDPTDGPVRLVSVGRLHWKKGYEWGLAAVAEVLDRGVDVRLRIIGDGPFRAAVERGIDDLGLGEHVTLLGGRPHDVVRAELQAADVFVHSAVTEGFCNGALEAQACAVPVVAADAEGLGENVADGVTGYVVPRRRPDLMADRIVELALDPQARRRMGAAGRQRAARFSPQAEVDGFVALYRTVLDDGDPEPGSPP